MQTDNTPISTYIFINKITNKVEGESKLTKYEVSQLNYALGLNGSNFKYINKKEIKNYE